MNHNSGLLQSVLIRQQFLGTRKQLNGQINVIYVRARTKILGSWSETRKKWERNCQETIAQPIVDEEGRAKQQLLSFGICANNLENDSARTGEIWGNAILFFLFLPGSAGQIPLWN